MKYSNEQLNFLSEAYDTLYNRAQELLNEYNPCEIINGECVAQAYGFEACCSRRCKYISSSGCTIRNLKCKMHLCGEVLDNNPEMERRWYRLQSYHQQLLIHTPPWETKEHIMQDIKEIEAHPWRYKTIYL